MQDEGGRVGWFTGSEASVVGWNQLAYDWPWSLGGQGSYRVAEVKCWGYEVLV